MSEMQSSVQGKTITLGGIIGYPSKQLHEEVACLAFYFHWSLDNILALEHNDRRRWIFEISELRISNTQNQQTLS
jgi:hypothetical protein